MVANVNTHIAYRCPECGAVIYGFVGKFALAANLLRLKCSCGGSFLDVTVTNEKKIRLSVPCIFCRQNHNFVLSDTLFFSKDLFLLNCPYTNTDVCFVGEEEKIRAEVERNEKEFAKLAEELIHDGRDEDAEKSVLTPDVNAYDTLNFLIRELEADGKIDCPCHSGKYDLRFTDSALEVFCEECGAKYTFAAATAAQSEEYLALDSIELK